MALSQIQCLDDNHVNPRTHESKPEFFYSEDQRLALESLLLNGREAFGKFLRAHGVRDFLSDPELDHFSGTAEVYDPGSELCQADSERDETPLSLQYWPELSDCSLPQLDLGWPDCAAYRGVTRVNVYAQPPLDGLTHIKEVVRKTIAQAQKVIAVVMDVFTDVDIFRDLLDAGFKRKVSVYILLERTELPHFLSMCERAGMHAGHLKNLRVCCTGGAVFYTRSCSRVRGRLGHRFMFVDGDKAISGSYSFTWMASRLDRHVITMVTGQAVDSFDRLFRDLYLTSSSVNLAKVTMQTEPQPEPELLPKPAAMAPLSAAIAKKLINPKYALVSLGNASSSPCSSYRDSVKNSISQDPPGGGTERKTVKQPEEAPPLHPGLANLERAYLIAYLPTWPEPDPASDVIGFINVRDASRPTQVHLQRSERFETSQAIRFSSPFSRPEHHPLPDKAQPRLANTHTSKPEPNLNLDTRTPHTGPDLASHAHTSLNTHTSKSEPDLNLDTRTPNTGPDLASHAHTSLNTHTPHLNDYNDLGMHASRQAPHSTSHEPNRPPPPQNTQPPLRLRPSPLSDAPNTERPGRGPASAPPPGSQTPPVLLTRMALLRPYTVADPPPSPPVTNIADALPSAVPASAPLSSAPPRPPNADHHATRAQSGTGGPQRGRDPVAPGVPASVPPDPGTSDGSSCVSPRTWSTTSEEYYKCYDTAGSGSRLDQVANGLHPGPKKQQQQQLENTPHTPGTHSPGTHSPGTHSPNTATATVKEKGATQNTVTVDQPAGRLPAPAPDPASAQCLPTATPEAERPASEQRDKPQVSRETDGSKPVRVTSRPPARGQQDGRVASQPQSPSPAKPPRSSPLLGGGAMRGGKCTNQTPSPRETPTRPSVALPGKKQDQERPTRQSSPYRRAASGQGRARISQSPAPPQQISRSQSVTQLSGGQGPGAGAEAEDVGRAGQAKAPFGLSFARLYQLKSLKDRVSKASAQKKAPPTQSNKGSG